MPPRVAAARVPNASDKGAPAPARGTKPAPAPAPKPPGKLSKLPARPEPAKLTAVSVPPSTRMRGIGGGGDPLPEVVRTKLEKSLDADLSGVRVHTDSTAHELANTLSARGVTHGSHIFLRAGEQPTDLALMGHEVAHVLQQQGTKPAPKAAVQRFTPDGGDAFEREARSASTAVMRGDSFTVRERTSRTRPQRLGLSDALNYFADKANLIPGFRMFTIVLGVNPINMSSVDRSAGNILRALIEVMPMGQLVTQALDNAGIFDKVSVWADQQLKSLAMTGSAIKQAITEFLDTLSWSDIFDLGGVWNRAKRIFTEPIGRLIDFAKGLVKGIVDLVKEAILKPLAKLAEGTRGYDLLKAVLGEDPVTGEKVPRTAETLIPGFLKLIGEEEVWENAKKANAIPRLWAWFQGALEGLLGFVRQIPTLAINAFKSLELIDIVLVPRAFAKIAGVFGSFIGDFISWAGKTVWTLLELIFEVVSPQTLAYIKKVGAAFKKILKDPMPFVGNLVKAAMAGFENFAGNILDHLKNSLIEWLTGSLTGIYIPKAFNLKEILKFVLSIIGLSWANVRQKIVKLIGEPTMVALETAFDLIVTLIRDGPAAAWDKIKEQLGNLQDMAIGAITDLVIDSIVKKAIPKIVAMFIPGAGFISAIISIYDTIKVFVEKIKKIVAVVTAFIDSLMEIAEGKISGAAKKVESGLAGVLTLVISLLAGFIGLGGIPAKVAGAVNKYVRGPVDKALDWLVNWIVTTAKKLFSWAFGKDKKDKRSDAQKQADLDKAIAEAEALEMKPEIEEAAVKKGLAPIKAKYKLASLNLVVESTDESKGSETVHIEGEINPKKSTKKSTIQSKNGEITALEIVRPSSFSKKTNESVNPDEIDLLKAELDRCHVVSSRDMAVHYESNLVGKKWSEAKKLVEKKEPVNGNDDKAILAAVKKLHKRFFNDVDNLFLGGASVNRALGERIDKRHPDMKNANKLKAHIKLMVDRYCFPGKKLKISW